VYFVNALMKDDLFFLNFWWVFRSILYQLQLFKLPWNYICCTHNKSTVWFNQFKT